ncbi:DUF1648 domain-containing protein [Lentibacillus sediminis]|uniref:DUF1648 domain-containing protein n=1 Tax=Lentibacillus sediminis TaxID=1940529 RepID=UPI000C1B8B03|nr:DUF5808 domain-containing protein [Lentibacillus sediminis]
MGQSVVFMLFLILLPVFAATMFMPYLTRRTESFGVSIPEDVYQSSKLRAMRKQYAMVTGMIGMIVFVAFLLFADAMTRSSDFLAIGFSAGLVVYLVSMFVVYLKYHYQMKRLKAEEKWAEHRSQQVAVDMRFRDKKLIHSNGWFAIPFLISFGTLIMTLLLYDRIPERIPMQYDFNGNVTNWSAKSYRSVMVMPVMMLYLTLLFLLINVIIGKVKQQLSAENPEKSMQQNIIFRRRWSGFIIITGTALTLLFFVIQLSFIVPVNAQILTIVPLVFGLAVTVGAIVLSFTTGQGGSRIVASDGEKEGVIDRDDDRFWKLGQFYFNNDDPALFIEKRFGVGWTINVARPLVWIFLVLIILLAVAIPVVLGA